MGNRVQCPIGNHIRRIRHHRQHSRQTRCTPHGDHLSHQKHHQRMGILATTNPPYFSYLPSITGLLRVALWAVPLFLGIREKNAAQNGHRPLTHTSPRAKPIGLAQQIFQVGDMGVSPRCAFSTAPLRKRLAHGRSIPGLASRSVHRAALRYFSYPRPHPLSDHPSPSPHTRTAAKEGGLPPTPHAPPDTNHASHSRHRSHDIQW